MMLMSYSQSKMVEHDKSESTKTNCQTTRDTMYFNEASINAVL